MPGNDNAPLGVGGVNQKLAGSGTLAPPTLANVTDIATARRNTAQQQADLTLRCINLRAEATRLNETHCGDPHASWVAAQLRDLAHILEAAADHGPEAS
jgi:hypothetical protein